MSTDVKKWTEDWLAVCLGLLIFALSFGVFAGADLLGWAVTTSVWTSLPKALGTASKAYSIPGLAALAATAVFLLVLLSIGARLLGANVPRFARAFAAAFALSYLCWIAGSWAYIAATPDKRAAFHIPWSLNLTNEAGFIVALVAGLLIGNLLPSAVAFLRDALRPELYVKTAIVILGGFLGITAVEQISLATAVMFKRPLRHHRGLSHLLGRRLLRRPALLQIQPRMGRPARLRHLHLRSLRRHRHRFRHPSPPHRPRHGVVAGGRLRRRRSPAAALRRPDLPLAHEPMVAGAWMGLAVKTDGAAVTSGAITDSLIRAKVLATTGVAYQPGWIMGAATTVKVFIRRLHRSLGLRPGLDLVGQD